jgi:hypothetical protein
MKANANVLCLTEKSTSEKSACCSGVHSSLLIIAVLTSVCMYVYTCISSRSTLEHGANLIASVSFLTTYVGLLGRRISPAYGLNLHRTTQHRQNKDKYLCPKWDTKPRSSVRALKARPLHRAAMPLAQPLRVNNVQSETSKILGHRRSP